MASNDFLPKARSFKFIDEIELPRVRSLVKSSEFYFLSAMYSPFCLRTCTGSLPVDSYIQFTKMEVYIMQTMAKAFEIVRDSGEMEYADALFTYRGTHSSTGTAQIPHGGVSTFDVGDGAPFEVVSSYAEDLLSQAKIFFIGSLEYKTIAYIVAKVAAVLRLYHSIGRQFMKWIIGNQRYRHWFQYYGSDMFKSLVEQIEYLLNKSFANLSVVQLQLLDDCYRIGLSNLLSSFTQQSVQAVVPILAPPFQINDIYLVCQLSCVISFKEGFSPSLDSGLVVELGPEYKELVETLVPFVSVSFDMRKVEKAFQKLSDLKDCLHREIEASEQSIQTFIDHVLVNSDFILLINKLHHQKESGCPVHLYSLDFSPDFINSIFQTEINNRMMDYSVGISTSRILKYPDAMECSNNICVGSVVEDLLCLLRAEIGIVVEPAESLIKLATKFAVKFVPLLDLLVNKQQDNDARRPVVWKHEGILYVAKDWCDVAAFVCCLHNI
ncbi:hypothetical protein OROHE_009362 [Orobanche hederae]